MMNNKRGAAMLTILFAAVYFLFGMIAYQFLMPDIATARVDMSCASPATSGDAAICLILDGIIPLVIIGIMSTAAGYVTSEVLKI